MHSVTLPSSPLKTTQNEKQSMGAFLYLRLFWKMSEEVRCFFLEKRGLKPPEPPEPPALDSREQLPYAQIVRFAR